MIGPWRLLRFLFRTILWSFLTWLILVILWACLPFPSYEHEGNNGSDYATSMLLSGKWLTRVYFSSDRFGVETDYVRNFALDYRLHVENLTLEIGGYEQLLPLMIPVSRVPHDASEKIKLSKSMQNMNVTVRIGDEDGANLPWFAKPDAVLLHWAINKENRQAPLVARWSEQVGLTTLTLMAKKQNVKGLFEIKIQDKDPKTIVATVPNVPDSGSPSMTYPIRLALIFFIAPTTVFVNDHFGFIIQAVFNAAVALTVVVLYGLLIFTVFSCWRCLSGASLETTIAWTLEPLDHLIQDERLFKLRIDELKEALEGLKESLNYDDGSWAQWFVQICRKGWLLKKTRTSRDQAKADLEKNIASAKSDISSSNPAKEFQEGNASIGTQSKRKALQTSMSLEGQASFDLELR